MADNISDKIIRNTLFNTVGTFWQIIITLVLTPYIISYIGIERFGIWAIVGVLTGYFGLLDFGIGTGFVKYISEYHTKNDYKKINQIINTGVTFYSILAILIIIVGLFFINPLLSIFSISEELHSEAQFVFMLGIIIFCLSNALSAFGAIQNGLQRMDITNKISIAVSIPMVIGTIYFLESGYGLRGLMINNAIIFSISSIINIIIGLKLLPELRLSPFLFDKEMLKKLFSYGYKLQISRFAQLVSFQTDKLLITYFLGIGLVVFYQIGSSITQLMRQIPLLVVSALIPAASEIEARNGRESLNELYLRGSKHLIFISTPLLFFVIINASLIVRTWMGEGYEMAVSIIQILAIGYYANTVTGVASSIASGVARTEFEMKFGSFMAILNLCLGIILIIKIGFIGVVIGTTISLTISSLFFMKAFNKYLGCLLSDYIQLFYKPLFSCIIPTLIILFLNYHFWPSIVLSDRLVNLSILGLKSIIFGGIYIIIILSWGYIDEKDKRLFRNKIPLLRYIL